ncbi:MAG: hypothetical protein Q8876_07085 [Bacillota bacterium]|nr:hypothetical protein [Bacillota bacterium]
MQDKKETTTQGKEKKGFLTLANISIGSQIWSMICLVFGVIMLFYVFKALFTTSIINNFTMFWIFLLIGVTGTIMGYLFVLSGMKIGFYFVGIFSSVVAIAGFIVWDNFLFYTIAAIHPFITWLFLQKDWGNMKSNYLPKQKENIEAEN